MSSKGCSSMIGFEKLKERLAKGVELSFDEFSDLVNKSEDIIGIYDMEGNTILMYAVKKFGYDGAKLIDDKYKSIYGGNNRDIFYSKMSIELVILSYDFTKKNKIDNEKLIEYLLRVSKVDKNRMLEFAVAQNNTCLVKHLVEHGVKVNAEVLYRIVLDNNYDMLKCLVEGGNVKESDKSKDYAVLLRALMNRYGEDCQVELSSEDLDDNEKIIRLLVEKGADVNKKFLVNGIDCDPLSLAAWHDDLDMVEYLAEHGASTINGLYFAVESSNYDIVKCLVEHGVSLDKCDEYQDYTLLSRALMNKYGEDCQVELSSEDLDDNEKIIRLLVEKGVDINKKLFASGAAYKPLNIAVRYNDLNMVKYLVEHGAYATSGLYFAIKNKNYDVLEYLVEHGANVNIRFYDEGDELETSLILAVREKNLDMVKFLVEHGANVNRPSLKRKDPKMIDFLVKNGIIPDGTFTLKKWRKWSSLEEALKGDCTEIAEYLINKGAIKIRISKFEYDKQKVSIMLKRLLEESDVKLEINKGYIKSIDVIYKQDNYRLVLRKDDGKAYKRYIYKEKDGGYSFVEKKKKERKIIELIVRKPKKLVKKLYRILVMKFTTLEKLSKNKKDKEKDTENNIKRVVSKKEELKKIIPEKEEIKKDIKITLS